MRIMTTMGVGGGLFHQVDGNLVIYDGTAIWHTDTAQSTGARLVLQGDGDFVMYTQTKSRVWLTDTRSQQLSVTMRLTLTNDGHLELRRDGDLIWTSDKSKGTKVCAASLQVPHSGS